VSIGTAYGANDTVADNSTTVAAFTLTGAVDGKTYYCRVFSVDNAGNIGPFSASSDGITVDTTAPTDFTVEDDGDYTTSNTTLHATWTSATDDVSGVAEYQYEIGTSTASGNVVSWTTAGTAGTVTRKNLALQNGVTYYITVRARNGANLWTNLTVTDGIMVDTTVPSAGTPAAAAGWATSTSITWSWTASTDSPSGIKGYYITIGSTAGGSEVLRDGFTPDVSYTFPSALNARTYYAKIKAVDNAGNVGAYGGVSPGVMVDISIPVAATPTDAGRYSTATTLVINWSASEDSPSGISGYFLSIGTTPGGSDVLRDHFTANLTYTLTGAAGGGTYYAEIKAVDNAGNEGPWSAPSDGITVDTTAPGAPVVYGGGYVVNATALDISWGPSIDLETPVLEYLYAVGTTPGGTEAVAWRSAGLRLSLALTGLSLSNGRSYYLSVRSRNAAGLLSDIATGDAVIVDNIAPSASAPVPPGAFTNSSVVTFVWNESADAESGIAGYYVYIGTTPGGKDVLDGVWTPRAAYAFIGGLNGVTYYASVKAADRAGNIGPLSPPGAGVTVDTSMPSAYPPVAPSAYSMYPNITWTWTPSTGSPSGTAGYYVSVGTLLGGEDAVKDHWTAATSYTFAGGADGKTYYIKLRAGDNAGNLGGWVTGAGGVTVDLSTPAGNVTIEGGAATTARTVVMLTLDSPDPFVAEMQISQYANMAGAGWEPFTRSRSWQLPLGDGSKTIYVKFRSLAGQESEVYSATITLDTVVAPFKLASSAGTETRDSQTTISGNVEPGSRVFINGELLYFTGDGTFHKSVQLQEGSNVITVSAVDSAGNSATQTLSVWRTLVMVLALIAIFLVVVVLVVGIRTQRMLAAHLRSHHAPEGRALVKKRVRPLEEPEPGQERPEEKVKPVREPWPTEPAPTEPVQAAAPEQEQPRPRAIPEQAPAQYRQPAYEVEPEPQQQWAAAPQETQARAAPAEPGMAAYPPAEPGQAPMVQPREGDVIIRADGTEAPAEPRLISEWSPDTGAWQPVTEEPVREEAAPPSEAALPGEQPGQMAPEPARAMEEFARSAAPREERPARAEPEPESVPAAPAQRLSAKQIYAALYGKRAGPSAVGPAGAAPAAPATVPAAPAPPAAAPPQAAPAAAPAPEKRVLGRARCANCKGIIPIYSAERPLRIKCPSCGLEGMIK
jgi:hypothetical protein